MGRAIRDPILAGEYRADLVVSVLDHIVCAEETDRPHAEEQDVAATDIAVTHDQLPSI